MDAEQMGRIMQRARWEKTLEEARRLARYAVGQPDCVATRAKSAEDVVRHWPAWQCVNPLCPDAKHRECRWRSEPDTGCLLCNRSPKDKDSGRPVSWNDSEWVHLPCLDAWVAGHPAADPDVLKKAKATLVAHGVMGDPYGGETGGGESA